MCITEPRKLLCTVGSGKYGKNGLYTTESFPIPNLTEKSKQFLAETANFSIAKSTWSTYKTTGNHLKKCQNITGQDMSLPMNTNQVTIFLSWLLEDRRIKPSSAESYLAGLRQLHLTKGLAIPTIRSDMIKSVLKGAKHRAWLEEKLNPPSKRLPMSLSALNLLGLELNSTAMNKEDKRLIWTVSLIAFFGSFRMGELLLDSENHFDPTQDLLTEDVFITKNQSSGKKTLQVRLKSSKENRSGREIIVDLFENDTLCPIKAMEAWTRSRKPRKRNLPAFLMSNGCPLTKKKMNKILDSHLNKNIPSKKGFFSNHSFRSGIPSMLGTLGYSTEEIMCVGRWSSNSYECYVKTARTKRQKMAREIAALV